MAPTFEELDVAKCYEKSHSEMHVRVSVYRERRRQHDFGHLIAAILHTWANYSASKAGWARDSSSRRYLGVWGILVSALGR